LADANRARLYDPKLAIDGLHLENGDEISETVAKRPGKTRTTIPAIVSGG
jgi:hypothetical protein